MHNMMPAGALVLCKVQGCKHTDDVSVCAGTWALHSLGIAPIAFARFDCSVRIYFLKVFDDRVS